MTTPCVYSQIGELNANMAGLLATELGVTTPFKVHSDSAPTVYLTGNPVRTNPSARAFERATGMLTATNPMTGNTDPLTKFLADPVEQAALHMVTADPARTPTFTMFADPNYFLFAGAPNCNSPCVTQPPGFAWNHGDVQPDITRTWLGMVGPGIDRIGIDGNVWSDHTDIRPTLMVLLGLRDDYSHDGRALTEGMSGFARPDATRESDGYLKVAAMYKQLNATVGDYGLATLAASTRALESGRSSDDSAYVDLENRIAALTSRRNALASQMIAALEKAEFSGRPISERQAHDLLRQGQAILQAAHSL